jgi:hypothetical protein
MNYPPTEQARKALYERTAAALRSERTSDRKKLSEGRESPFRNFLPRPEDVEHQLKFPESFNQSVEDLVQKLRDNGISMAEYANQQIRENCHWRPWPW